MLIGYAHISTDDQNLDAQLDALNVAGTGRIYADRISGSKRQRPELDRMLDQLRDGDVVMVTNTTAWCGPSATCWTSCRR